jgi:hypothetical protein
MARDAPPTATTTSSHNSQQPTSTATIATFIIESNYPYSIVSPCLVSPSRLRLMASTPSRRGSVRCFFPGAQQQQMIQGAVMIDVRRNINSSFQTKPIFSHQARPAEIYRPNSIK